MHPHSAPDGVKPRLLTSLGNNELHVWRVRMEHTQAALSDLERLLSREELVRAARFQNHKARASFVAGRGILRMLLGWYLGMAPREAVISPSINGKPECLCPLSKLSFNLSHSGDLILLGVGRERLVGVDVECLDRKVPELHLARRFFTEEEAFALEVRQEEDRHRLFFEIWVRKEAYLKALSLGLSVSLQAFKVPLACNTPVLFDPGFEGKEGPMVFYGFSPGPGYLAALVTGPPVPRIRHLDWPLAPEWGRF